MKRIGIGTKFRYTHADGNPEWTVTEKRGRGTWIATVMEDEDWTGTQKAFSTEEIRGSLQMASFWQKSSDESESFYESLALGSIVHYNNGFKAYVRCQVTNDRQLLPIALVGKWSDSDLPRRYPNGKIEMGYHAEKIQTGKKFRPHASNVWEFNLTQPQRSQPIGFAHESDPRQLVPISLALPPMTEEQIALAKKHRKLEMIQTIANGTGEPDTIFIHLKNVLDDEAI